MLNKDRIKGFTAGVIVAALAGSLVTGALAAPLKKSIQVAYNNIKLVVDGTNVQLGSDVSGQKIEPFIYNGTTYLPVAAVGRAIGKKVSWDGKTQTVYVGAKPGEVQYMTDTVSPYQNDNATIYKAFGTDTFSMGGKTYNNGYVMGNYSTQYMYFNLNGEYDEITGELGAVSWEWPGQNRSLNIYLDGKLYQTIEAKNGDLPTNIKIPVKGVMQLEFESPYSGTGGSNGDTYIGLGNVIIK